MPLRLLVAGSNSGCQLGVAHDEDVRMLREALCRIDPDLEETTAFPPIGFTVTSISSGANHTLALVQSLKSQSKEIWVTGTGAQGQLGPDFVSKGPTNGFVRFDLESCIEPVGLSGGLFEPKQVICGWNCSFIVLTPLDNRGQEVLISLGSHRENTFGELGCPEHRRDGMGSCVHVMSFTKALTEAGLSSDIPFKIGDVAAGLRHVVAVLDIQADSGDQGKSVVVGWGSGRHGQVGKVPRPSSRPPAPSSRPGPAPAIVFQPQLIFHRNTCGSRTKSCTVRAGRDFTVVMMQRGDITEEAELHYLGRKRPSEAIDASTLPSFETNRNDITDMTCNWNSVHFVMRQEGQTLEEPRIFSCGSNSKGQLGTGTRVPTSATSAPSSVDLKPVTQLQSVGTIDDENAKSSSSARKVTMLKMVSGSEHSLLLVRRQTVTAPAHKDEVPRTPDTEVWGWGWNEHGNLAQGPHDEADRDRPVSLLNGKRSGTATPPQYTPLDIWAGCGTTFILADRLSA